MNIDECKFILDKIDLDPEVKEKFWKELTEDLKRSGAGKTEFSTAELKAITSTFTDQFIDRSKRLKYARIIIKNNRAKMKASLKKNPINFLKELPQQVEIERDVIYMSGDYEIRSRVEKMSDSGTKFKNGELDEEIYNTAVATDKDPTFKHEDKDVQLGYELMTAFDKWDYEMQVMSGVAVERLEGHLLKYQNQRAYLIEHGPETWMADQKEYRNLKLTYGLRTTGENITKMLEKEYWGIIERKGTNSSRPNRLMYRGVVMKPGAVILHNKKYGAGTIHSSMTTTLKRMSNDTALQTAIPLDRGTQRGIDIKDPTELIDKVIASDWAEFEKIQAITQLEKSANDETGPHLLYLVERIGEHIEELNTKYRELVKEPKVNKKELKKLDKEINYLENKGRAMNQYLALDPFMGKEPTKQRIGNIKDNITNIMNITTKGLTAPLLSRGGWIAAFFDVIPQYARNMEIWGSNPTNIPGNLWKAVSKVVHTSGHGKIPGRTAKSKAIADSLGMMLNEQNAFHQTLGMSDDLEGFRAGDDEGIGRSILKWANNFANMSFSVSGIHHQNISSFDGSLNIEMKGLYDSLVSKTPTESAANFFANYNLTQQDILALRQSIIENGGELKMGKVREKTPLLHHRLKVSMAKNAFHGTPRNNIRTEKFIDNMRIFGKKPLKGDSKIRHALSNMHRSLIKTNVSAVLEKWELLSRNQDLKTIKGSKEVLNRLGQALTVGMMMNGSIAVLRAAIRPSAGDVKDVTTDKEEFMRVFIGGMASFEYLGIFRDLVYNVFTKNYYGVTENILGPVGSKLAVAGQTGLKAPGNYIDVMTELKDEDEVEYVTTKDKYRAIKTSNVAFNIPFLEALTDEFIVEKMVGIIDPDGLEEYLDDREKKMEERQEAWGDISDFSDLWKYFRDAK